MKIEELKAERDRTYREMCTASHDLVEAQEQYDESKREWEAAYEAYEKAISSNPLRKDI